MARVRNHKSRRPGCCGAPPGTIPCSPLPDPWKSVHYISTRDRRSRPERLSFGEMLLAGLARDGGLYVPAEWPRFDADRVRALAGRSYAEIAVAVVAPFIGEEIEAAALDRLVDAAYAGFGHAAVAPLKQLAPDLWLLELFHGPTLAFKDYALQLVGRLFDHVLAQRGERVTIIGATSGDTGSAAIEACRDRAALDIFILYPRGRISEVQRRQMTTVASPNVHAIAIEGTFDDCQDLVKAMFADTPFRDALRLSAVNSINWARIMAQAVYYFVAAVALGAPDRKVGFSVPTGNFGNVFAAHVARRMGLPIAELIIGTNRNDILARLFDAHRVDDEATRATIAATWRSTGELIDPHSAVALAAAQAARQDRAMPMVSLACAHPAKFPEAVESATGRRPALPPRLADLMSRPERITALPNDLRAVENHLRAHARGAARGGAA